jgi:hypothetical protein
MVWFLAVVPPLLKRYRKIQQNPKEKTDKWIKLILQPPLTDTFQNNENNVVLCL